MNIVPKIAFRYLFSKKSSQAIHWITAISIFGIAVGTAALILVLSVFNGFEDLLSSMFSKHNPDVKIVLAEGKRFKEDSSLIFKLKSLDEVAYLSKSLEETALFEYGDAQDFGIIQGVDEDYIKVIILDSAILEGKLILRENDFPSAILGLGMRNKLGVDIGNVFTDLKLFIPSQAAEESNALQNKIKSLYLIPKAIFNLHQEIDYDHVFTHLEDLRNYLGAKDILSSIEIKLKSNTDTYKVIEKIQLLMGPEFIVKDRYKQDEAFLKIMNLEKWLFYALFCLTLLLVSFTLVGTIWMIVLDKKFDIAILKSIGMNNSKLRSIFLITGINITAVGLLLGFILAAGFYLIQKEYGIIGVPEEFIIESYPIKMKFIDFFTVGVTVLMIGLLASFFPSKTVDHIQTIFVEE
ncbi:MAG: FtsX-like permease family protein [Bacteroidota bacterium]|nr:FtsX-like permease family protein [Bacteroidota bacterium]